MCTSKRNDQRPLRFLQEGEVRCVSPEGVVQEASNFPLSGSENECRAIVLYQPADERRMLEGSRYTHPEKIVHRYGAYFVQNSQRFFQCTVLQSPKGFLSSQYGLSLPKVERPWILEYKVDSDKAALKEGFEETQE